MDEIACNYDPAFTIENETDCDYESCAGCMYEFACNYDSEATIADNASCEFGTCPGCTDSTACNYNPTITVDDGSCDYTCIGCQDEAACNYNTVVTVDDGSCLYASGCDSCSGETDGTGTVIDNDADDDGVCDWDEVVGCQDGSACNYNAAATDPAACEYASEVCSVCSGETDGTGVIIDNDADDDGVCDWDEIPGCQDAAACNYNAAATDSDEELFPCLFAAECDVCTGNPSDGTGTVIDGDSDDDGVCDWDEVVGCQDAAACNFKTDATDAADCIYATACGECSGETDGTGYFISYDAVFDGYTYDLVAIGDQCWFAENLRTEHYTNGDAIPANLSDGEWSSTTSGAVSVYGEDAGCSDHSPDGDACDPSWSLNEYGRLYNWYAVDDERGLCPTGWHVPTDGEYTELTDFLGGLSIAGTQMKTTYGWDSGGNGTNSSGFSGLPGGNRGTYGFFVWAGIVGSWWSSSPSGSNAWHRYMDSGDVIVYRDAYYLREGLSVRCVRDE